MEAFKFLPRDLYSYLDEETPCVLHKAGYFRVMKFDTLLNSAEVAEIACGMCPFVPKIALAAFRQWASGDHSYMLQMCIATANASAFRIFAGAYRLREIENLRDKIVQLPGFIEAVAGGMVHEVVFRLPSYLSPQTYETYQAGYLCNPVSVLKAGNFPLLRHLARKGVLFESLVCREATEVASYVWREVVRLGFSKAKVEAIFRKYGQEADYQRIKNLI